VQAEKLSALEDLGRARAEAEGYRERVGPALLRHLGPAPLADAALPRALRAPGRRRAEDLCPERPGALQARPRGPRPSAAARRRPKPPESESEAPRRASPRARRGVSNASGQTLLKRKLSSQVGRRAERARALAGGVGAARGRRAEGNAGEAGEEAAQGGAAARASMPIGAVRPHARLADRSVARGRAPRSVCSQTRAASSTTMATSAMRAPSPAASRRVC